jgi:nucleotide-binding universal stress UspA family protein
MKYFEKILVPVDFTVNTNVAITKAIELSVPGITSIELVHVSEINDAPSEKLNMLANSILSGHHVEANVHIVPGSKIEPALINFAKSIRPDLIIIGKNNHHSFFPFLNTIISPNIAEETNYPVLTVKPGSLNKRIETVVMPVSESFPSRKIELLATLNRKINLNVHLLTIFNNNQQPDNHLASVLLQAMKSIREKLKCNVHHAIIHSNNKAIATLRYAEKIRADILLVSPETETTINSWISKKDITDVLKPASHLQVLSIQPN